MRILIVHNRYRMHSGEDSAVDSLTALLKDRGNQVVTYMRHSDETDRYAFGEKLRFPLRTLWNSVAAREISGLVRREKPDIAHIHNVFPLLSPCVYRALHRTGVAMVQTIHNFRLLCPGGLLWTNGAPCELCKRGAVIHAIARRCYRESYIFSALYALTVAVHRAAGTFAMIDRFIALTDFSATKLVESGLTAANKISVLGNFLPDPLPDVGPYNERQASVVFVGRLSREKGLPVLIEAVSGLPELRLKIMGDGPQRCELERLAARTGATNVEFLGFLTGEDKWSVLRSSMASVLPSVCYENFPVALLESLAVGTPAVVSDIGALPYLIENGKTGLTFKSHDVQDLQDKLRHLISAPNEAVRMGQCGRILVDMRFSAAAHYEALMKIYEDTRQ